MSPESADFDKGDVQGTVAGEKTTPIKPPPVEHIPSPPSPAFSGRHSFQSHSRRMSTATELSGVSNRANRSSLSFPIHTATTLNALQRTSPVRQTQEAASASPSPPAGAPDPHFLTAIAAQERRVLELKEEWTQAEAELVRLKRQWTLHEAQKKRNESRSVTKLQPLQIAPPQRLLQGEEEHDVGLERQQQHQHEVVADRRKSLGTGMRPSTRRVFSASRHTRTLSLLSPVDGPDTTDIVRAGRSRHSHDVSRSAPHSASIARSSTLSHRTRDPHDPTRSDSRDKESDALLRTSKKIATDFKDGLWTFWEDLRQATVGDDATTSSSSTTNTTTPVPTKRPGGARATPRTARTIGSGPAPALADPSFFRAAAAVDPCAPQSAPHAPPAIPPCDDECSSQTSWPSSPGATSASASASDAITTPASTAEPSPRTSDVPAAATTLASAAGAPMATTEGDNAAPLPWPTLVKLGPQALRRTASHLMAEWERSVTPSPGREGSEYLEMGLGT